MKWKTSVSLLIAVALGLLTAKVGRDMIMKYRADRGSGKSSKVVVAKRDLDPGSLIEASDLTLLDMPAGALPDKSFADPRPLIGRAIVSPIVKGQVLFDGLMAAEGADGGLQALVPDGMRAVTVEVSESSGLAGLVLPGSHVDVIATLKRNMQSISRTIVENVQVRAVGRKLVRDPKDDSKSTSVRTVTLICTPKNAEAIELASTAGRPRLVLRSKSDEALTDSLGITMAELTGEAVEPQTVAPATQPVDPMMQSILAELHTLEAAATQPSTQVVQAIEAMKAAQEAQERVAAQAAALAEAKRKENSFVRRPVQVIRGGEESTIYYQVKAGTPEAAAMLSAGGEEITVDERAAAKESAPTAKRKGM